MKKLTKKQIEKMANEIKELLEYYEDSAYCIYFNNKRINDGKLEEGEFNPRDYFEWAATDHILSISTEGMLYDALNYGYEFMLNKFIDILDKYNVYYELGNSWNLTLYVSDDDMEVEYTYYDKEPDPIRIYRTDQNEVPEEIKRIAETWVYLQHKVGDCGSYVLGAGFDFEYKDVKYFLTPCSGFQGSIAWETDKEFIKDELEKIGCTKIHYNYGIMD